MTFRKLKIINKKQNTFRVWGSGIDLEDFTPKPIPDSKFFLMISRLLIEKGVYEFIQAASIIKKKYPDVIFRLIGGCSSNKYSFIDQEILETLYKYWSN